MSCHWHIGEVWGDGSSFGSASSQSLLQGSEFRWVCWQNLNVTLKSNLPPTHFTVFSLCKQLEHDSHNFLQFSLTKTIGEVVNPIRYPAHISMKLRDPTELKHHFGSGLVSLGCLVVGKFPFG